MAEPLPLTLRLYRLATRAATPLVPLLTAYRVRHGKENVERLRERRGESTRARPPGPLVWLHAASVGELLAVVPLIERIRSQRFAVLVTTGTLTSATMAERRLPPDVVHQFVPIDAPSFVSRFLAYWRPDLALFVESDLWPNLILRCAELNIPLVLVNGRLSQRSFERWRRLPNTIAALLRRFDLCLAQSPADAQRYSDLGSPRLFTTGNLKLDVPPPPADERRLRELKLALGHRPVFAAASTHPGEEEACIDAHVRLRGRFPGLLSIIAPRHPERGPEVASIAHVAGLKVAMRSRGDLPVASTDVYVVDTLGELGLVYRLAPIVFMGGSLANHGGQNPIEAAKLGAAVLHGPHVGNFADIYAALDAARGAEPVADASKLAVRIGAWLADPANRQAAGAAGRQTVEQLGGALEKTLSALDPYLLQLRLERRSGHG